MANLKSLVISSGQVRQILDADSLIAGSGLLSAGSNDLTISAGGSNIDIATGKTFRGAGTAIMDWSGSSGAFSTSTGTVTIGTGALSVTASQSDFTNNIDASGGLDVDADSTNLTVGAGADWTVAHDGIDTTMTSATGDFTIDNTNATGSTIMKLGTATSATDFQVVDSASQVQFEVDGAGLVDIAAGDLKVSLGDLDIATDSKALRIGAGLDLTLTHDGTNSIIDSNNATATLAMRLGSNTSATDWQLQNNSGTALFTIDGGGTGTFANDLTVSGNLTVSGTTTTVDSETVNIVDNHLLLNDGYKTDAAQTGGLVVNYDPTTTTSNVTTGGFTAGVNPTNDATVKVVSTTGFTAGDFVMIESANTAANNGVFEVHAVVDATTLAIAGVGVGGTDERVAPNDWTPTNFTTDSTVAGSVTKVAISVLRAGTDGVWETAAGSTTTGLSFTDLATTAATSPTMQDTYDNDTDGGNVTVTMNATDGSIIWAGDQDMQWTTSGTANFDSAIDSSVGFTNSGGELLVSGGNLQLNDAINLTFGTNDDMTIVHSGTAGSITNGTGNLTIENTSVTGAVTAKLGTATNVTSFQVVDSADEIQFRVLGDGTVSADIGPFQVASDSATALRLGGSADFMLGHDGFDNIIDSNHATATLALRLGSDDGNTDMQVQNNSGTALFTVSGAGAITASAGTLDVPSGTSFKIGGSALTTANFTAANMNTLLDGSNADSLHVHTAGTATDIQTSGYTETVANGGVVSMSATDLTLTAGDATSASGDTNVIGITEAAGTVTHIGLVSPRFIAGLSVTSGDRIYLAKDATGRVTTDVSAYGTGDIVYPLGYVRDNTGLSATTLADETCECILLIGEPTVL